MSKKITKNTTLAEVLKLPGAEKVLKKHEVSCLGCPFAKMEMDKLKIGDICQMYGLELRSLLIELNKLNS